MPPQGRLRRNRRLGRRGRRLRHGLQDHDVDFAPDLGPDNLDRLSAALHDLGARVRIADEGLPFNHTGQSPGNADIWNLTCAYGDFDITFHPGGPGGYPDLVVPVETE